MRAKTVFAVCLVVARPGFGNRAGCAGRRAHVVEHFKHDPVDRDCGGAANFPALNSYPAATENRCTREVKKPLPA